MVPNGISGRISGQETNGHKIIVTNIAYCAIVVHVPFGNSGPKSGNNQKKLRVEHTLFMTKKITMTNL